ncbi:MAG: CHAD domain-containing protein [Hyphomonadaceae bacterium]|nr:CHAD domain-containing protein [Hyphomonadaceae bacterium]
MLRSSGAVFDLRAAMSDELRAALDILPRVSEEPRALHACRVRVKRARALARVGHACAPGLSAVFNDTARGLMRMLGRVRDLEALGEAARTLAKAASRKKQSAALLKIAEALNAEAKDAPALNMDVARAGLKDLLALAAVWPEASPRQVRRGARRVMRRARKARRRSLDKSDAMHRHEWRKRSKDRFYAATLLDTAWPGARKRKLGEKLGDALGRERDALLLLDRLNERPETAGAPKAMKHARKALKKHSQKLRRRADKIGARLASGG